MAVQTKPGQLNVNDIIFEAPGTPGAFTRADEWDVKFSPALVNEPVTISLASNNPSYDPFVQVINAKTGAVIADSDDTSGTNLNALISPDQEGVPNGSGADDPLVPNAFRVVTNVPYKIRVSSFAALTQEDNPYTLVVRTNVGSDNEITLTERSSEFTNPQTGNLVNIPNQKLDENDFTFPAPGGGGFTVADEFKISATAVGQPVTVALTNLSSGFNSWVQVVNAVNGSIIAQGANNVSFNYPGGNPNLRARITSNVPTTSTPVGTYTLQANVPVGSVTVTPRMGEADISGTVAISSPTPDSPGTGGLNPGLPQNQAINGFYVLTDGNDTEIPPAAANLFVLALGGTDNLIGTTGDDTLNGNQGADTMNGGSGKDILLGGKDSDLLNGGLGDDPLLSGNRNNDVINGNEGNDQLYGGRGSDILNGGSGNDIISGDPEQDILTGGPGIDTFILTGGDAAALTLQTADVITDFNPGDDKIALTGGTQRTDLTFDMVSLALDGGAAVNSTVIKLGGTYLGIVQGVAEGALTNNVFTSA